ncbi:MAG TPA: tRNA (N6-threonylcarbamoyladenosine(37)-N6)-methyltransferase TrmO [Candidatus Limiplasma sp.]|nr:tRNA (N6-threonylcarbamoyladenosine(37)-N6)-methyltransferase TrmO [Candidatus Limiplasma sp.]
MCKEAEYSLRVIARIHNAFPTKFGLPRQSGMIDSLVSEIVFEPEYRVAAAFRGLEGYSHLWLLWGFSEARREHWSPTVRPPRLGGNEKMGVFATRSPFRPNPIGLSCVQLLEIKLDTPEGPLLRVAGADLMDGTPLFDVKPYLPYADCRPDARGGFTESTSLPALSVTFPVELEQKIPSQHRAALRSVLAGDPRPAYQNDPERIYGFEYAGFDVRFRVEENTLTVVDVVRLTTKI